MAVINGGTTGLGFRRRGMRQTIHWYTALIIILQIFLQPNFMEPQKNITPDSVSQKT